jgi:molybdopterin-biosynthesis enzyme MoeA-like protein
MPSPPSPTHTHTHTHTHTQGKEIDDQVLDKMSSLPSGACIRPTPDDPEAWPILQCKNVFVLPGVPQFFTAKLDTIATHFLRGATPVVSRRIRLAVNEEAIVSPLNEIVGAHPDVQFGSYPVSQGAVQTIITLEAAGSSEAVLETSLEALLEALPDGSVVEVSSAASLAPPAPPSSA